MIPRRFFLLFDAVALLGAYLAAYVLVPWLWLLLVPRGGRQPLTWFQAFFGPYPRALQLPPLQTLAWMLIVMALTALLTIGALGGHRSLLAQSRTRIGLASIIGPVAGLSVVTLVLTTFSTPAYSRLFIFLFALLGVVVLFSYRVALRQYFQLRQFSGRYAKNVLLAGSRQAVQWLSEYLGETTSKGDYQLLGYLDLRRDLASEGSLEDGLALRRMGCVEELGDLLVHHPIHEVIAVYPQSGGDWLQEVIHSCDYFAVTLHIVPEALLLDERKAFSELYHSGPLRLPAIVLAPPHWDSDALFFKRLFDIVVSAFFLIALSPIFAIVALAIKITTPDLPVFYPWHVVGKNGMRFTGYKFTTMVADADEQKEKLAKYNEMTGPVFKIKDDPRVTPLGRWLRKFSLNELPQFWSVLKGDMSLVGPRPAGPHELKRYEFWHKRKLSIMPGITCLWQVRGRNTISNFDDWVKMDLEYIDNWSLWLDFKILLWTAWVVVRGTGS